jgi:hypothetical protein
MAALPPGEPPVMHAARKLQAKHHFDCCLGPDEGEFPFRTPGKKDKPLR